MKKNEDKSKQAALIYNNMAEEYTSLFWEDHSDDPETDQFLKLLSPRGTILDAGCGPGNISRYLVSKGFSVIGVDFSEELIKIAQKKVPQAVFHVMDMRKLEFLENSFNGIYSAYSFMHIPNEDVLLTLKEYRKVLRPDGALFLSAKEGEGESYLEEPLANNELCYFNFYNSDWLTGQIEIAGFIIKKLVKKYPVTVGELPNRKLIYICSCN
jgi:2-polyprenyl-3-methyl-5-hydroxy-6-metoxy-1,4-benzoquinol methylase